MISLIDVRKDEKEIKKLKLLFRRALCGINAMKDMNEYRELTKKIGIAIVHPDGYEIKGFDLVIEDMESSIRLLDEQFNMIKSQ